MKYLILSLLFTGGIFSSNEKVNNTFPMEDDMAIASLRMLNSSGSQVTCLVPGQVYKLELRTTKSCGCIDDLMTWPGGAPSVNLNGTCRDASPIGGGLNRITWNIRYGSGTLQVAVKEGCSSSPTAGSQTSNGQFASLFLTEC